MTKKQLQQIKYLERELRSLRAHLAELEASVGITAAPQDGQPHGNKVGKPTETQAIALSDTFKEIQNLEEKVTTARKEAWTFVSSLEDSLLRLIITYRFVDGKSWLKVAQAIGGDATADGCRMYFNRSNIVD